MPVKRKKMPDYRIKLTKQIWNAIEDICESTGKSMAVVLNDILVNAGLGNDKVKSIVLQIPKELLNENKEGLREWFKQIEDNVVEIFYPIPQKELD